ncbi:hypothetical protein RUND412_011646, partial [Rhizina undulata]
RVKWHRTTADRDPARNDLARNTEPINRPGLKGVKPGIKGDTGLLGNPSQTEAQVTVERMTVKDQ